MSNLIREIIVIPATKNGMTGKIQNRQMKVAAYCRVSTDSEEQLNSFESQKSYYTDLILRNTLWKYAGTYADEGISGGSAEKRPAFMKMVNHSTLGKIDLIITKSMSRFSRNVLDSISYVRKLKALGVGVYFEKENINTLDESSELLLTFMAGLAEDELLSLSKNVKWGKRRAMQEGKVSFQYAKLYAYQRGADNKPEVIVNEAEIVKRIYTHYMMGKSVAVIARELTEKNILSPTGNKQWKDTTVRSILKNECYVGDVILQKTYIRDPLTKKVLQNNGELPKIYIKNNHTPIVARELFEQVQEERSRRTSKHRVSPSNEIELKKYSSKYALNDILICGNCNTAYKRVTWTKRSGEKQAVWRCYNRVNYGDKYCTDSHSIDEESLHKAIVSSINATQNSRKNLLSYFTKELKKTFGNDSFEDGINPEDLEGRIEILTAETMGIIEDDTKEMHLYRDKLKAMSEEIKSLQQILEAYKAQHDMVRISRRVADVSAFLSAEETEENQYNDTLTRQLIETIKMGTNGTLHITYYGGLEHEQPIELQIRKLHKTA